MNSTRPFISIIVPVLNERLLLPQFLSALRRIGGGLEIIVVDGGSSDGSWQIAESLADQVIGARRGRASQMNAGAEVAQGEALWFLHADSTPHTGSVARIANALASPNVMGGCFRLHYPRPELIYRVSDLLGNMGVTLFGFGLGDHGIFCRRDAFVSVRGYPDVPILEDAELYRKLSRLGAMHQIDAEIIGDPRTFEKCGSYVTTGVYFVILALYVVGVSIARLNRIYRGFHAWRSNLRVTAPSLRAIPVQIGKDRRSGSPVRDRTVRVRPQRLDVLSVESAEGGFNGRAEPGYAVTNGPT
ncbi:MAG TPA: TIGR04283 family arsenosugar biosynthesis glycosyltransferase [Chthoniobacterales bacterium]